MSARRRRIPRLIHQTLGTASVPRKLRGWVASWCACSAAHACMETCRAWAPRPAVWAGSLACATVAPARGGRKTLNPEWKYTLWTDSDCAAFVQRVFPEYAAAYAALPKAVERADFFRRAPHSNCMRAAKPSSGAPRRRALPRPAAPLPPSPPAAAALAARTRAFQGFGFGGVRGEPKR